jgi:hypothetical protein
VHQRRISRLILSREPSDRGGDGIEVLGVEVDDRIESEVGKIGHRVLITGSAFGCRKPALAHDPVRWRGASLFDPLRPRSASLRRAGEFQPEKSRPPAANPDGKGASHGDSMESRSRRCVKEFYAVEEHRILSGGISFEINAILGSGAPRGDSMESDLPATGRAPDPNFRRGFYLPRDHGRAQRSVRCRGFGRGHC